MSATVDQAVQALLIDTGACNRASVRAALRRLGVRPLELDDPRAEAEALETVDFAVLPGVGTFGPVREVLSEGGLDQALRRRWREGRPTLAICLGMQLLGLTSEEAPGTKGLGLLPLSCELLEGFTQQPHMGWNRIEVEAGARFLESGDAYFAHGYGLRTGSSYLAAFEEGPHLACQFHPELSGSLGERILARFFGRSA